MAEDICQLHDSGVPFSDIAVGFPEVREKLGLLKDVFSDFSIPWSSATGTLLNRSAPRPGSPRSSRDCCTGILPRRCSAGRTKPVVPVRPVWRRFTQCSEPRSPGTGSRIPVCAGGEMGIRLGAGFWLPGKETYGTRTPGDPLPVPKESLGRVDLALQFSSMNLRP